MAAAPAPAPPAPAAEEGPEPLKYHTLALRVSLHCEGCKREVKRVLQHIEGVYKVSFDSQQHKVVVTGNVAPETLIKKLNKTGKHAELWPEPPKPLDNAAGGGGGGGKKKKGKNKNKNRNDGGRANEPPENAESNQTASGDHDGSDKPDGEANGKEAAPPAEKQGGPDKPAANAGGGGGGGGGGKKKGKKGHNNSNNGSSNPGAAEAEVASQEAAKKAAGGPANAPPTAMSFPVQVPTYVVSYSSVQPSMSHGGAYHPMPLQHSSYVYSTASPGSYYIFSEENANACSVM
ncbi:hypothetical protein Cni_G24522 [Canna indica]|uniref:HMA domain-containing protein n=1 Tax=Canna indica TaxID=4628 RepID=A0AAQ3QK68_9LILI|nr:hypothetical protein Cni_G24522 [Canna indica]